MVTINRDRQIARVTFAGQRSMEPVYGPGCGSIGDGLKLLGGFQRVTGAQGFGTGERKDAVMY